MGKPLQTGAFVKKNRTPASIRIVSKLVSSYGPSAEIRCILIPFRNQNQCVAAVKPSASNCPPGSCIVLFESPIKKRKPKEQILFRFSWSECRDSNSGPLEPHSSAIPNFATPGKEQSLDCLSILAHSSGKCKHYFHFPESFFIQLSSAPALIFIGL